MGDHLFLNYHIFLGQQTFFNQGGFNNLGFALPEFACTQRLFL